MTRDTIFTLESLIAWLETQPGETEYCWADDENCLIAAFAKSYGKTYNDAARVFDVAFEADVAMAEPHTYADALERARALLPAKPDTTEAVERLKDEALAVAAAGHREPIGEL